MTADEREQMYLHGLAEEPTTPAHDDYTGAEAEE